MARDALERSILPGWKFREFSSKLTSVQGCILDDMSQDLSTAVLSSSPFSLGMHRQNLPDAFHLLAMHAAHPSMLADSSLQLNCADCNLSTAIATLRTFTELPHPQRLSVSNVKGVLTLPKDGQMAPTEMHAQRFIQLLVAALQMRLKHVACSFDCSASAGYNLATMHELMASATQNSALQTLAASFTAPQRESVAAAQGNCNATLPVWASGLSDLHALRSLSLHNIHLLRNGANRETFCTMMHDEIGELKHLTRFVLTCDEVEGDGIRPGVHMAMHRAQRQLPLHMAMHHAQPLAQCMRRMHELQELELSCHLQTREHCEHSRKLLQHIESQQALSRLVLRNAVAGYSVQHSLRLYDALPRPPNGGVERKQPMHVLPQLRQLDLSGMHCLLSSCDRLRCAEVSATRAPGLQQMVLKCSRPADCDFAVVEALSKRPDSHITCLHLSYSCVLEAEPAGRLLAALGKLSTLQNLKLQLSISSIRYFLLPGLVHLTSLVISRLGDPLQIALQGSNVILDKVDALPQLRNLTVHGANMSIPTNPRLQSLELVDGLFDGGRVSSNISALMQLTNLTCLHINQVFLSASTILKSLWDHDHSFYDCIEHLTQLQELALTCARSWVAEPPPQQGVGVRQPGWVPTSPAGWIRAPGLQPRQRLKTLYLRGFKFQSSRLAEVPAEACASLTALTFQSCEFQEWKNIWGLLSGMSTLQLLDLSFTEVKQGGFRLPDLVRVVEGMPRLRELVLLSCGRNRLEMTPQVTAQIVSELHSKFVLLSVKPGAAEERVAWTRGGIIFARG